MASFPLVAVVTERNSSCLHQLPFCIFNIIRQLPPCISLPPFLQISPPPPLSPNLPRLQKWDLCFQDSRVETVKPEPESLDVPGSRFYFHTSCPVIFVALQTAERRREGGGEERLVPRYSFTQSCVCFIHPNHTLSCMKPTIHHSETALIALPSLSHYTVFVSELTPF